MAEGWLAFYVEESRLSKKEQAWANNKDVDGRTDRQRSDYGRVRERMWERWIN